MTKQLTLIDSRRLTGKNLLLDVPAAIIDVEVTGYDKTLIVDCWLHYVSQLQQALGWSHYPKSYRFFDTGISLAIAAPIDGLYAAAELNEAIWLKVAKYFSNDVATDCNYLAINDEDDDLIDNLKTEIFKESNDQLLSLIDAAQSNNVPYLWDDDEFSLGFGPSAQTWPIDKLPYIPSLAWHDFTTIPVVYVTGTNGKSTTVRIMSEIFKHADKTCGVTSTDFIKAGQRLIDTGDYSGPGGARMLLRQNDVQVAVLEVARGGLLRRGLPIPDVDGAIITNVAEDHLGQYGINDVAGLASTKFLVAKGLSANGTLVLNADDTETVRHYKAHAHQLICKICWFAKSDDNELLKQQRLDKKALCYEKEGGLYYEFSDQVELIASVASIPMTLQGAAQHNVLNALGAIGLAKSLQLESVIIAKALQRFKSDGEDNPGRGNFYKVNGATVIVDFAHNVHSMQAMTNTLKALPARKKWLMLGHAGDRSDTEISNLTRCIMDIDPDYLMIVENPEYLRGRSLGDIPQLITDTALSCKMLQQQIFYAGTPTMGTKQIIEQLQDGDLVFLMVLSERDSVVKLLAADQL
jgi:UDP-N-acetylmuramyl tripeptide synthase